MVAMLRLTQIRTTTRMGNRGQKTTFVTISLCQKQVHRERKRSTVRTLRMRST